MGNTALALELLLSLLEKSGRIGALLQRGSISDVELQALTSESQAALDDLAAEIKKARGQP